MEFRQFKQALQRHVASVLTNTNQLYVTDVDRDTLWETYLNSFPPGANELFRERREYDCSCCRQFIKQFGNVIALVDNKPISIWDFETGDTKFQPVVNALSVLVKAAQVRDVFVTKQGVFGTDRNHEQLDSEQVHTWEHFRVELPTAFVTRSHKSEAALRGELRDTKNVFRRSLEEIAQHAIETVLDLVAEKSLYKGDEWRGILERFLDLHNEYHALPNDEKDNCCWSKSVQVGGAIARIRNHSIGVLLQNITDGIDIVEAVRKYEAIVAPENYKRPKAIFTKRMVQEAQDTVERLGLLNSLPRRHARLDDITVNNVLWSNRDAARYMRNGDVSGVFEMLKAEVAVSPRQFERLPGTGIDDFIRDILPDASSLEVLFENRHQSNLVSLIAPQVADSPPLFKWDSGFSWAYAGNLAASSMRERVKAAGGQVDGVLRFSLQWNEDHDNRNDFDAHCREPGGNHIYYPNKAQRHRSSGMLDVDIIHPNQTQVAVENIIWTDLGRMPHGEYRLYVHNYSHRGGRSGFSAEVEFGGQIYEYEHEQELAQGEEVTVARVRLARDGFKIVESLPSTTSTRTAWSLQTNQFHPASIVTFSPNYWDGQHGIGHKHTFFMLAGCENPDRPNGFYNEFLRQDFVPHRRVFEALGSKMRVESSDNQLSGLGFSSTRRDALICKVDGKAVKIVF